VFSIGELFDWLTDAENWTGRYGLANLFVEHLTLTLVSLAIAGLLAIPIGVAIGQSGRGETLVIAISSASRAIPTMGLMFALVMVMGVEFRQFAVVLALVGIAIPPVLAGAYAGIKSIPIVIREGARAQGMTTLQQIRHVIQGLALRDFAQLTGSAAVIVLLSITGERLFAKAQGKLDRRLTLSKTNR
jgi:osmoprotectant transport system permease protein